MGARRISIFLPASAPLSTTLTPPVSCPIDADAIVVLFYSLTKIGL